MPIYIYSGICDVYSFALLKSIHCHTAIQHQVWVLNHNKRQWNVKGAYKGSPMNWYL